MAETAVNSKAEATVAVAKAEARTSTAGTYGAIALALIAVVGAVILSIVGHLWIAGLLLAMPVALMVKSLRGDGNPNQPLSPPAPPNSSN